MKDHIHFPIPLPTGELAFLSAPWPIDPKDTMYLTKYLKTLLPIIKEVIVKDEKPNSIPTLYSS